MDQRSAQGLVSICGEVSLWGVGVGLVVGMIAHNTDLLPMWLYWADVAAVLVIMGIGIYANLKWNVSDD